MFRHVLCRISVLDRRAAAVVGRCVTNAAVTQTSSNRKYTNHKDEAPKFDEDLLQFLVCPLSKKPLRFDADTNELINEELGIAYPIVDGIPNMIPEDARLIQKDPQPEDTPTSQ